MKKDYYVYVYCDPREKSGLSVLEHVFDFLPIYIGYGRRNLLFWHLKFYKCDMNLLKINKIKAIPKNLTGDTGCNKKRDTTP